MNKSYFFVFMLLLATSLFAQDSQNDRLQILNKTLKPYGVDVLSSGYTDNGVAFIKYEQRPTSSSANVHASQIMALSVIANEYPKSNFSMSIAFAGKIPILVVYARTADVNAFSSGKMSADEFSNKVYAKILAPDSPEVSKQTNLSKQVTSKQISNSSEGGKCLPFFVFIALFFGIFILAPQRQL